MTFDDRDFLRQIQALLELRKFREYTPITESDIHRILSILIDEALSRSLE